jgi:hypothetical protein
MPDPQREGLSSTAGFPWMWLLHHLRVVAEAANERCLLARVAEGTLRMSRTGCWLCVTEWSAAEEVMCKGADAEVVEMIETEGSRTSRADAEVVQMRDTELLLYCQAMDAMHRSTADT